MTSRLKLLVATTTVTATLLNASAAFAAGTTVGTSVLNNVNVNYNVGGVAQTQKTASNTFVVDRKVNFTVTETVNVGTTSVSPGQSGAVTTLTVTNLSNAPLGFGLSAAQLAAGAATAHGPSTDAFDLTGFSFFVDGNNNGTYEAGTDTATSITSLAADANIKVFMVGTVPLAQTTGQMAGVSLTATARNTDGSAITGANDTTVNGAGTVETVFADAGGNGIETGYDDYTVSAASLTVTKLSRVVSDGVNTNNPKAIPGAVVEYCIVVTNAAGSATAASVAVSDNIAAVTQVAYDTTFTPKLDGTVVSGSTCTPGATNATYSGGIVSGTLTDIAAGQTRTLVFRAVIQ